MKQNYHFFLPLRVIYDTPSWGEQVYTLIGLSLPVASILTMHSPTSSSTTYREDPLGAEITTIVLLGSFLFMDLQILMQSS